MADQPPFNFEPRDPDFASRVRASFARQAAMDTIGARLEAVEAGRVVIDLPFSSRITQQHGFVHAGILATALDSACGYAGSTLMPADAGVLTIEFKIHLMAPAQGQRFRLVGSVIKPGRTVTFTEGQAFAVDADGGEKLVATLSATLMTVTGRPGIQH